MFAKGCASSSHEEVTKGLSDDDVRGMAELVRAAAAAAARPTRQNPVRLDRARVLIQQHR